MNNQNIEVDVLNLVQNLLGTKIQLDEPLFDGGLVDSMTLVDLTLELETQFNVKFSAFEVKKDNFETPRVLAQFILKKK